MTTQQQKIAAVYGIWNIEGKSWIINDDGSRFQTVESDVALDAWNKFKANGANLDALLIAIIPFNDF